MTSSYWFKRRLVSDKSSSLDVFRLGPNAVMESQLSSKALDEFLLELE